MSFKKSKKVSAFQVYSEEQVQPRLGRSYGNVSPRSGANNFDPPPRRNEEGSSCDRRITQDVDRHLRGRQRNSDDATDARYLSDINEYRKHASDSPDSGRYPDDSFYDKHGSNRFKERRWDDEDGREQADDYLIVDMKDRERPVRSSAKFSDSDDECLHESLRRRKHNASFSSEDEQPMWGSERYDEFHHDRKRRFSDSHRGSISPPSKLWRRNSDDDSAILSEPGKFSDRDNLSKKKKGKGKKVIKSKGKISANAALEQSGKIPSLLDLQFPPSLAARNLDPTSTEILPSSNSKIFRLGFRNRRNDTDNHNQNVTRYEKRNESKDSGRDAYHRDSRYRRHSSDNDEGRRRSYGDVDRSRHSPDFNRYYDSSRSRRDELGHQHSSYNREYRDRNIDFSSSSKRNRRNSSDHRTQRDRSPDVRAYTDSEQDSDREGARRSWREERRDQQPNKRTDARDESKSHRRGDGKISKSNTRPEARKQRDSGVKEAAKSKTAAKKEDRRRESEKILDPSARFHVAKCSDGLAIFLTHPQEICLRGRAQVQVLSGSVSVLGYKMSVSEKTFDLYSPTSGSLITMQTGSAESDKKVLRKVLKLLEVDEKDVKDFMAGAVILKAQQLVSPVSDYICTLPPYTQLFKFSIERCAMTSNATSQEMVKLGAAVFQVHQAPNLPLKWSSDMDAALDKWTAHIKKNGGAPLALLCGGVNSGKSTFSRYMVNAALNIAPKVCYLNCDVGQTEFSPPGVVSLTILEEPILGPPFCHQRKAERMCFFGLTSPGDGPTRYVQCLQYVWEAYQALDPPLPLVINTMGWNEGLGLKLFVDVLKLTCPDMVIQFHSSNPTLNFPAIDTRFSALEAGWLYNTEPVEDEDEKLQEVKTHELITVQSLVNNRVESNKIKLTPKNLRDLALLAHLMDGFHPAVTLTSAVPYAVPWCNLAIHVCHSQVSNRLIWAALNASVVALCSADLSEARRTSESGPLFFDETPICDCLGYGLVRAVDTERQLVYIVTSLPRSSLANINTIIKGAIAIPDQLFLKQSNYDEVPYVDALTPAMALGPVKPRSRMPRRTGAQAS